MMHQKLIHRTLTIGALALLSSACSGGAEDTSTGDTVESTEDDVPEVPAGLDWNYVPGAENELAPSDARLMEPGEVVLGDSDSDADVEIAPPAPPREDLAGVEPIAAQQQALFNGKCKSVRIKVHNTATVGGDPIWVRIKRAKYWDLTSGVKRSEDLAEREIFTGQWTQWSNEDLEETKDHRVGSWFIIYQFARPGEPWSTTVQTEVIPFVGDGELCDTDELFEMNLGPQ